MVERRCLMPVLVAASIAASVNGWAAQDSTEANPANWRHIAVDRAATDAEKIADPYRRAEVLASIARAQTFLDDSTQADQALRAALTAARDITEPTFQGWILHEIVLAQIAADDMTGARQTAQSIRSERPRGAALAAIATVQLRAGNIEAAQTTAQQIKDDGAAAEVLRQIVAVQAARGDKSAARQTLRRIRDDYYEAVAAGDIAVADVRSGEIASATALASDIPRQNRAQVYERIAVAVVDRGDSREAAAVVAHIDDPIDRALVQARLAMRFEESGNHDQSQSQFAAAVTALTDSTDKRGRKPMAWAQMARMQAMSGDVSGARESLARAEAVMQTVEAGQRRDQVRDLMARSQIRMGDSEGALANAAQVDDRITQALLIRDVVAGQPDSGRASALLRHPALQSDPLKKTAALFGVIGVQLLRKDEVRTKPDIVAHNIQLARASVHLIPDAQIQPAALSALAAACTTIGNVEAGQEIFDEALQAAASLPQPQQRAAAYVRIVNALDERLLFLGQPVKN